MPTTYYLRLFLRWALGPCPVAEREPLPPPAPAARPTLLDWRAVSTPLPMDEPVEEEEEVDDDGSEAEGATVLNLADWRRGRVP